LTESTKLYSLPTLDKLAADPGCAEELSPQEAEQMLAKTTGVQTALLGRILSGNRVHQNDGDTLLKVEEAAKRLDVSKDWLYRHAKELPFTMRIGRRQLRFSDSGIEKYIKSRTF